MGTVTVFGGSGFVGRYVVKKFAERGDAIRVAVRNPVAANFLKVAGDVGQITPIQASVSNLNDVRRAIEGADVVVNLVGILFEKTSQTFEEIHVKGARNIAKISSELGVPILLHMSALGASEKSSSHYALSKAKGEQLVLKHFPRATLFRPSVIFGAEDNFLNRFAEMACFLPALPLIGGGKTRFQPIYVEDVAEGFLRASYLREAKGKTYELGGPLIYSFEELMVYLLKTIHRNRLFMPIPFPFAKVLAAFAQLLPTPPLTLDQVELLKSDTVVSPEALQARDLDLEPTPLETIAPAYLKRYCPKGKC